MQNKKRSFFERLTGSIRADDYEEEADVKKIQVKGGKDAAGNWMEEENEEAELTVDVYQTSKDIIVQTMVAGVKPDDLELTIGRDMVTIKGKRQESRTIDEDNYFVKELFWGTFSRTIMLPQEVEPEEAEAVEKHGLLTITMPKIDKNKKANLKVKSS
ncbi:MAG: Hsp20/alpha crystallin family protein [Patescibacteria group bacterium]